MIQLEEVRVASEELAEATECTLTCPCGVKWTSRFELAPWWRDPKQRYTTLGLYAVSLVVAGCAITVIATQ